MIQEREIQLRKHVNFLISIEIVSGYLSYWCIRITETYRSATQ